MKRFGVDPSGIGLVLLSHLHGDHFAGIPFLILDGQFSRRTRPLLIAGPPGVEGRVREAMEVFFPGSSRVQRKFPVEFSEMKEGDGERLRRDSGDAVFRRPPQRVPFLCPARALRGKEIGYSGDTEWSENLIKAARGTDLFISECYFFDKKINYHLNYQILKDQKENLGSRRLVLTHMGEEVLNRLQSIVDMEWAEDGKKILI